jgi:nitroimidazol reductase NimA-like FMN-containing flavoprotein (pyridoxamine 5'-phosphate oxidase superfamily)
MPSIPEHLVPSRLAKRAHFDRESIYAILDEALFCTVSYVSDGKPFSIPTAFVRYEDKIYVHGSLGSHFIREIEKGIPVCITVTLLDAIVAAKSAFHHSINYRSVVLFARGEKLEKTAEKKDAFEWLTNKIVPDSWNYLRPIKENEIDKTTALAFSLAEASAKIRTDMPVDEEEDQALPIWSGLLPLKTERGKPIPDGFSQHIPLPDHLNQD